MTIIAQIEVNFKSEYVAEQQDARNEIMNAIQSFVNGIIGDHDSWPMTNYAADEIKVTAI